MFSLIFPPAWQRSMLGSLCGGSSLGAGDAALSLCGGGAALYTWRGTGGALYTRCGPALVSACCVVGGEAALFLGSAGCVLLLPGNFKSSMYSCIVKPLSACYRFPICGVFLEISS